MLDEGDDGLERVPRGEPDFFTLGAEFACPDPTSAVPRRLPYCPTRSPSECIRLEGEVEESDELLRGGVVAGPEGGEDAGAASEGVLVLL